ncbi:hypothetical protein KC717_00125 [Candidatus Dojkabacteria bacterium]|uniref:Uncharacterized protein n=1 Tax=Candidatus Dojkabacteria bacterium TaxID=2099670 RepID=A0A955RK35_9BACT|nr:hypothetical protein [Candidatus Dojkabacteria bacterium]
MSPSLVKLVDASILPAAILIVAKAIGLYLVISFLGLEWQIEYANNSIFSVYPVVFKRDVGVLSTYSDLFVILVMLAGYGIVTFRATHLHNSHIDPKLVVTLAKLNFLGLVKDSYKIYHTAAVWILFSLVAIIFTSYNVIVGTTAGWVIIIGLLIFAGITVALIRDIEDEIARAKKKLIL